MKVRVISVVAETLGTVPKKSGKDIWRIEDQRKNRDHPDNSTVKIGKNALKSLGDLKRVAVPQTSMNPLLS